ncbi:MAG: homoserine kinase [Chthoniobacteraceae bacterium]
MNHVSVRVPASTANLGPGFDCLGVALQLYNRVTIDRTIPPAGPPGELAGNAAQRYFQAAATSPFDFSWSATGEVPRSRGLGSSVTIRLGLMHGLNVLCGTPLSAEQLFELCTELEGHPDNAAPAAFGGFTIARTGTATIRAEVDPSLKFVLLIPDFEIATPGARAALPDTVDRRAAVMSCVNATRIAAAFLTHRYEILRDSFDDGLHQPYRESLIPCLGEVIAAGVAAGALGGYLSGSGSTICCLTLEDPAPIAAAMFAAAENPGAQTVITSADNAGTMTVESPAAALAAAPTA